MQKQPIPKNEMERVISLADYDLDYTSFQENFKDLAKLAAKVAGTEISLINLIDSYTQWTITNHGLDIEQMPREDSVCQYTIAGNGGHFEVPDLRADDRFKDKFYVADDPSLRYYYGIPLTTDDGHNLGALCMLDKSVKTLSPEKEELLKIIAGEIVNRLNVHRVITGLKTKLHEANETKKKVAHDIRGPLGGIIGLAQVISEQGKENEIDEVLEFIELIQRSGRSLLELADEILTSDKPAPDLKADEFNLIVFKDKLQKLYTPQAINKKIMFIVNTSANSATVPFSKNKLLQITGNLISNAMKFTPVNGKVLVDLSLEIEESHNLLKIRVTDTGIGLNQDAIDTILQGRAGSTSGTLGEQGYGFGLALVKHLVDTLHGSMYIHSQPGHGASFEVILPQVWN
ncbi:GAF domain-containing sensor histidine kinase [Mucilaginibacter sp. AK015]|uniref:GAF domain-containing sensor histidine kinase n=1 Tax=Mucilaginibacter sp. AK015 TaxID=2723072 RepID=UPI0016088817|nr:GAF domain-containing sensor histidine kinase [Mucilaginibacter sp. AK015]MBB5397599.1 signal transduction histidine kinase [Mucilaginibacter sp. AK015]